MDELFLLRWLFVVAESGVGGGSSGCCPQVSHCGAFCCAAQAVERTGFSSCASQALAAHQAPLSMGFSRQWSGVPLPSDKHKQ